MPPRCPWGDPGAGADPTMVAYHDGEWGVAVTGDRELFERLSLEAFQAGLSWQTILRKRDAFREAFRGFEPALVAAFDAADRARLLDDTRIVRNRLKVEATIENAGRVLEVADAFGSFDAYLRSVVPGPPRRLAPGTLPGAIPSMTPASDALSRDLRARGFRFMGSTVVYAFMQSVGLVDDHLPGCFRYRGA